MIGRLKLAGCHSTFRLDLNITSAIGQSIRPSRMSRNSESANSFSYFGTWVLCDLVHSHSPIQPISICEQRNEARLRRYNMYLRPLILGRDNCEETVGVTYTLARIVKRIVPHVSGAFRILINSLHESRRREGARLIRQYRHLIDDRGE
jgi:hypothetical protein